MISNSVPKKICLPKTLIFDRLFALSCGFGESIFQCPTMRYSVFKKFSCYTLSNYRIELWDRDLLIQYLLN